MPTIIISPTAQLQQVDDFPEDCERTVKGALYIRPSSTLVVSEGEAAHLTKKGIKFTVAGRPAKPASPTASAGPAPAASPAVPAPKVTLPDRPVTPLGGAPLGGAQSEEQK